MSQHAFAIPADGSMSPQRWYQEMRQQPGFIEDPAQAQAIVVLDELWHQLVDFKAKRNHFLGRSLLSPDVPKGLYFWGGVGRGKSFLMDVFYACVPYRRKRRVHFHQFMAEVHQSLKQLAGEKDPLLALADKIAKATRLLCFDEFHVSDIADAMILGRLLEAMFARGVVLITTSNYPPEGLYPDGLQRQKFLPTIALLQRELRVLQVDGGNDYRLREAGLDALYYVPADAQGEIRMAAMFERLNATTLQDVTEIEICGRSIAVERLAQQSVWFKFSELCGSARDQSDYLALGERFSTVFLSEIPVLTADMAAAAQRFTWLVDVFYDMRVKLVVSAAAKPEVLYAGVQAEFTRTVSRLMEMQTREYQQLPHQPLNKTLKNIKTQ